MLLCSCQDCREEFQDYELDELLGLEEGQVVTLSGVDVKGDSGIQSLDEGLNFAFYCETQGLKSCNDSHPTVTISAHREWDSFRRVNMEQHKCFCLHSQSFKINVEVRQHGLCVNWYYLDGMFEDCEKGIADIPVIGGKGESIVPIITGSLHGINEKDISLKGTVHNVVTMTDLNVKTICDYESPQLQREIVESIRKCSPTIDFNGKTRGDMDGAVFVLVYRHTGIMNFLVEMKITVTNEFNLDDNSFKKNPVGYFLITSEGDRLKHVADAQVRKGAAEVGRFRLKDLKLKSPTGEARKIEMRAECKGFVPLHSDKINCKMKVTKISSRNNHERLLKPSDCDKTTKDLFEWMIAWEGQDSAEFIK